MKFVKLIVGIVLILFLGHLYNQWDSANEETGLVYIEMNYPNGLSSITIKKVPLSKCDEKLDENVKLGLSSCPNCVVETEECYSELPGGYEGIFDNESLDFSYVAIDSKYPERHIMLNMPEGGFDKFCAHMTKRTPSAICIP